MNNKDDFVYVEVHAWLIDGVVYTDYNRAIGKAMKDHKNMEQLYRKVINPPESKKTRKKKTV